MTYPSWPTDLPQSPLIGYEAGPADVRAAFTPDVGEEILRPRTTGAIHEATASFILQGAEIASFETFFATTLKQGSLRFAMREPSTDDVRIWKVAGGQTYRKRYLLSDIVSIELQLIRLPAIPWFAPYVPASVSTVPAFVADYANDIYGIDGVKTAASAMPTIEGTFDVTRTVLGVPATVEDDVITAGEIPATAPTNTTLIVGFHP